MIKRKNKRAEEEVKKKEEEEKEGAPVVVKAKKCAGELRLQKEITELDLPEYASTIFNPDGSIMEFVLVVDLKQVDCIWKGGKYEFTITVPRDYPFSAPKCICKTPIYHPNIDTQGFVCLNILREDWKPVLSINSVILGLIFLFYEPNSNDPLNHEAAEVMRKDLPRFKNTVFRTLSGATHEGIKYPKFI